MANRSSTPDRHSLADPFPAPAAWRGDPAAALFSPCGRYRWWLVRHWCPERSPVLFVGLNPSTADAGRDDPTLRRLCGLAGRWGHGGVLVLNLFSRVGSDPAQLRKSRQPVGEHTDAWMATALGWLGAQPPAGAARCRGCGWVGVTGEASTGAVNRCSLCCNAGRERWCAWGSPARANPATPCSPGLFNPPCPSPCLHPHVPRSPSLRHPPDPERWP
jgi:hypothetical protein